MTVNQISVFLENKPGQLREITDILSEQHINLRAISIAETADYGVLRLIVDDHARASAVLLEHGFILTMTPVVAVGVPDQPGGLNKVLGVISDAGIGVEYMYAVFAKTHGEAYMIFRVSDIEGLCAALEKTGLETVSGEALGVH